MDNKPYYLIGDVDIHNMEEYKIYMQNTKPIVEKYGGEYLVRGGAMDAKDTQLWKPTRMVLIKFPNKLCFVAIQVGNDPASLVYLKEIVLSIQKERHANHV